MILAWMFILGAAATLTTVINNCLSIGLLAELPYLTRRGSIASTFLFILQCILYVVTVALPVVTILLGARQIARAK